MSGQEREATHSVAPMSDVSHRSWEDMVVSFVQCRADALAGEGSCKLTGQGLEARG